MYLKFFGLRKEPFHITPDPDFLFLSPSHKEAFGSVIYGVEIFDAPSSRLLGAYVTKQYPNAYDIRASIGALDAATAGIDRGADAFVAQLN